MTQISGAYLLSIRTQAASNADYASLCKANVDLLSEAYLTLQIENVSLRQKLKDANLALLQYGNHEGHCDVLTTDEDGRHYACDCGYEAAVEASK